MSNDTLHKTIILKAEPATVWKFLTDKDKLAIWFHPADTNLEQGKPYALLSTNDQGETNKICWGDVLEMQPHHRLVQTFTVKPLGVGETKLVWTLDPVLGGTRLSLEHSGIAGAAGDAALEMMGHLDVGWDKHFASLRESVS